MGKQKVDIEIGSKPSGKKKAGGVGKTHPMAEKTHGKKDVTGQELEYRLMRCWNCGGISHIWYDTVAYHTYSCCFCGADNTL